MELGKGLDGGKSVGIDLTEEKKFKIGNLNT